MKKEALLATVKLLVKEAATGKKKSKIQKLYLNQQSQKNLNLKLNLKNLSP